jgi:NAD(P)-dependent dehydrogenase (short-subunit alcohol dehydrogenase family)
MGVVEGRLEQRRILVVGASSGIGLATARALAREGARVALCARRAELLESHTSELGRGSIAVPCDVTDPRSCERAVAQTVEAFGGMSDLVYAAGIATLTLLADATNEAWSEAFETNVVGPSQIMRAALPQLSQARGRALFLSSIAPDERPPRRGLGIYSTTKAALNRMIECWQEEERAVSFTRVSVGDTGGTDMARDWDPEKTGEFAREWSENGFLFGRAMEPADVAEHLIDLLASREAVPVSSITPRFPTS